MADPLNNWSVPDAPRPLVALVDGRCGCEKCVARTGNLYRMVGTCTNCGASPILMLFRAGDSARQMDCPVCGKYYGVSPQRLATADEIPEAVEQPAPWPPRERPPR